jgi:hypothetical protein
MGQRRRGVWFSAEIMELGDFREGRQSWLSPMNFDELLEEELTHHQEVGKHLVVKSIWLVRFCFWEERQEWALQWTWFIRGENPSILIHRAEKYRPLVIPEAMNPGCWADYPFGSGTLATLELLNKTEFGWPPIDNVYWYPKVFFEVHS